MKVADSYRAGSVTALFPGMEAARRAIDALQNDGIEANSIALSGEGAEAARRAADSQRNTNGRDAPILWRVVWRCVLWSIVGAVLGVAVGFGFGISGLALPGTSNSVPLQVVSWAMFLHVAGALWGAYAGISNGSAWELTFQPASGGRVFVTVAAASERESLRAERVLRSKAPLSVYRAGRSIGDAATDDAAGANA